MTTSTLSVMNFFTAFKATMLEKMCLNYTSSLIARPCVCERS